MHGEAWRALGQRRGDHQRGTWVLKPRHQWHTFWNPGDEPFEIIEVISSAGFEDYFREVAAVWGDMAHFAELNRK